MTVYQTKVVSIGSEAEAFQEEKMVILFGKGAPVDLADYTYNIEVNKVNYEIKPGMTFSIDDNPYTITAVGNVVNKNLNDLGHITIRFTGETEAGQPGTLCVESKEIADILVGSVIKID